ncbi:MAG: DNA repair protein RecO [Bacteroidetes bacterium]|nr:DNA repair protein RecO [Bacteroidota bacterium]MBU1719104.1 DNA repair protein RecO [Bacteroidota bacterium]
MLRKIRGVVLRQVPYKESTIIVNLFSRELGRKAFMIHLSRKNPGKRAAIFSPLAIIDLEAKISAKTDIHHAGEVSLVFYPAVFFSDPMRASVGLFISEILQRTIIDEEPDAELFCWMEETVYQLDNAPDPQNTHLRVLLQLATHLGFGITHPGAGKWYFDLREGRFSSSAPLNPDVFTPEETSQIFFLMNTGHTEKISNPNRRILLEKLLLFYHYHIPSFGEVKSFKVFQDVFA